MDSQLKDLVANLIIDLNRTTEIDKQTLYNNCTKIIEFLDIEYARELDDMDHAFDEDLDPAGGHGLHSHE